MSDQNAVPAISLFPPFNPAAGRPAAPTPPATQPQPPAPEPVAEADAPVEAGAVGDLELPAFGAGDEAPAAGEAMPWEAEAPAAGAGDAGADAGEDLPWLELPAEPRVHPADEPAAAGPADAFEPPVERYEPPAAAFEPPAESFELPAERFDPEASVSDEEAGWMPWESEAAEEPDAGLYGAGFGTHGLDQPPAGSAPASEAGFGDDPGLVPLGDVDATGHRDTDDDFGAALSWADTSGESTGSAEPAAENDGWLAYDDDDTSEAIAPVPGIEDAAGEAPAMEDASPEAPSEEAVEWEAPGYPSGSLVDEPEAALFPPELSHARPEPSPETPAPAQAPAAPAELSAALGEVAGRLEAIARALRDDPARFLAGGGDAGDPLGLLVTGFVLGYTRRGGRGS